MRGGVVAAERAGWTCEGVREVCVVEGDAGGKEREDVVRPCMRDKRIQILCHDDQWLRVPRSMRYGPLLQCRIHCA